VRGGRGIEMGIEIYAEVKDPVLGLIWHQMLRRVVGHWFRPRSLGDNEPLKLLIAQGIKRSFGMTGATLGMFSRPDYPLFMVGATNRLDGTAVWFPADTPLEEALVASSAIPGVFPWRDMLVAGEKKILVDGGVVTNQPVSNLVLNGCGTIYTCMVGFPETNLPQPRDASSNAWGSLQLQQHQCMKLEAEYARLKLGNRGSIHCFRPDIRMPVTGYDLTPLQIRQVVDEAHQKTVEWLDRGMPDEE
jgi:predicted acylesterase/phospholipase RssA